MKQNYRVAIKRTGIACTHYIIRSASDLVLLQAMISDLVSTYSDIEYIKWIPIPAREEG